jgi:fatty acid-binding protein DegV
MKPLVSVLRGELTAAGKCIGTKKAFKELFRFVDLEGGIDYSKPFAIGYTGSREQFTEFEQICKQRFGENEPIVGSIGSVIGTHAGPGGAAVVFFKNL